MEFNQELKNYLEDEINIYANKNKLQDKDNLDMLDKLLSIYNGILNVEVRKAQLDMMVNSNEMMKNVDFSKIDFGGVLNKFLGK